MQKNDIAEITVQSLVLPNQICEEMELYVRYQGEISYAKNVLCLQKDSVISTNTYMNCFDVSTWNKYTGIDTFALKLLVSGKGHLRLLALNTQKTVLEECEIDTKTPKNYILTFKPQKAEEILYFEIESKETLCIESASYITTNCLANINDIHLDLIICTYKRNAAVLSLLKQLEQSLFFEKKSTYYGSLCIRIVDNASELDRRNEDYVKIYHNPNNGGSGGFTRGILESRKEIKKYKTSHVILMDDDVQLLSETLYRVYALLSLCRDVYQNDVIAGRMFCMDTKYIQYTSSEIWNGGALIHVNGNEDMRREENLIDMNKATGEYTGWWFGCFPINFIQNELPLPFFLHCDDVEYGLRHGGYPLVLNGVQVWHETHEHRITPSILYYDIRNTMIVNTIHGQFQDEHVAWRWWKSRLKASCSYVAIVAMKDYLKGCEHFAHNNTKKEISTSTTKIYKLLIPIFFIILSVLYKKHGKKAFESYKTKYALKEKGE